MKKSLVLFLAAASLAMAGAAGTWTGTITDSMCVQDHAGMNVSGGAAACVRACVKGDPPSSKYVLFDGKHTYKLSDQKLPEQYAARKVIVKGTLYPTTGVIKVESIRPAE